MKKRILGIIMYVALAFAMCPMMAMAAEEELTINAQTYDSAQLAEDFSGTGYSWDAASKTLTLSDYNAGPIETNVAGITICAAEGTDNTIISPISGTPALKCSAKTTINGKGNLTIKEVSGDFNDSCVSLDSADIYFKNEGSLTIKNAEGYAICADTSSIRFMGKGDVSIISGRTAIKTIGDSSFTGSSAKQLVFSGSGKINISSVGCAIESDYVNINVYQSEKITVETTGVLAPALYLQNGKMNIQNAGNGPYVFKSQDAPVINDVTCEAIAVGSDYIVTGWFNSTSIVFDKINMIINDHEYTGLQMESDISNEAEGFDWDASEKQLTLNNYNGKRIEVNKNFTLLLANGSNNTVTNTDSDNPGIYGGGDIMNIAGGGDLTVESENEGIGCCEIEISGSGKTSIHSKLNGVECSWGDFILSGSGPITVISDTGNPVFLWLDDVALLLNGTATPIELKAGSGMKAVCTMNNQSNIGGTNYASYSVVEGAPDMESFKLRITEDKPSSDDEEKDSDPEEKGSDADTGNETDAISPATGDKANIIVFCVIICACAAVSAEVIYKRKNV